ncbi:MAG: hypothetical protein KBA60_04625 [Flavobacteriales bacterium]|nr:hypothetical protein [Flavobacteriales bacterium]MBP7155269.1 hypothetical protein [Flavobacteriales bacterium]HQV74791.1 hypothetical protein [Flavobacteriales bacterium]HQW40152.1 hypothetical protein [Flavobacteriales bacterium]
MGDQLNHIDRKKPHYNVQDGLRAYLNEQGRSVALPLQYDDLLRWDGLMPQVDRLGHATLWQTVLLRPGEMRDMQARLIEIYQLLIADGRKIDYLGVASIDFCAYGNSQPFRIKVLNQINDNHDYFYIKKADSSRVYGLELEHMLSPNRINYLVDGNTLVEEHIIGVPGDEFIKDPERFGGGHLNPVRLSKEFVKFNERCFVRLLGDMRAYNFVVDVIQDFDQVQYRLRSIDFDQQCFEGRVRIYLPQFYKENLPFVRYAEQTISLETVEQYRSEERALLRKRQKLAKEELEQLFAVMRTDTISTQANTRELATELATWHKDKGFLELDSMGSVMERHLASLLGPS